MPKERIDVELGDGFFEIEALAIKPSKVWRYNLATELKPLFDKLPEIPDLELTSPAGLLMLVGIAEELVTTGLDNAIELLFQYSTVLEKDRQHIEDTASDKQAMTALVRVLKMTNPFDIEAWKEVLSGRETGRTPSKSPEASGVSKRRSSKKSSQ